MRAIILMLALLVFSVDGYGKFYLTDKPLGAKKSSKSSRSRKPQKIQTITQKKKTGNQYFYSGAAVYGLNPDTNKYSVFLGYVINSKHFDSVFNPNGDYGKFSENSVWDKTGEYGSKYSDYSAWDKTAANPPAIVMEGKIVGYLTISKTQIGGIHPQWLYDYFYAE